MVFLNQGTFVDRLPGGCKSITECTKRLHMRNCGKSDAATCYPTKYKQTTLDGRGMMVGRTDGHTNGWTDTLTHRHPTTYPTSRTARSRECTEHQWPVHNASTGQHNGDKRKVARKTTSYLEQVGRLRTSTQPNM